MNCRLLPTQILVAFCSLAFQLAVAQSDVPWNVGAKSPRIEALRQEVDSGDPAALERFWAQLAVQHSPLIEPDPADGDHSLVTFVYRGSKDISSVVLYTQMIPGRDPLTNGLSRLGKTNVWFKTYSVRNDMRLGYGFMPNPSYESVNSPDAGIADPLNPKLAPQAPYMGKSILELPKAPLQPWVMPRVGLPVGKTEELRIQSKVLRAERLVWIHTPATFDPHRAERYPLLICFDGQAYMTSDYMPVPTIVDNMIADGMIPTVVVVLIGQSPPPNRNVELSNNELFLDFVASEVLPPIREKWHATSDPQQTIVTGSSSGGLAAAFFALRRPDLFGNVLSQSGAFWPGKERNDPEREWLTAQYESSRKLEIRFVLQVGLLERGSTPGNGPSILDCNRHLRRVLENKGYEVHYAEVAGGHEPLNWRGGISDGLIQLIGLKPAPTRANDKSEIGLMLNSWIIRIAIGLMGLSIAASVDLAQPESDHPDHPPVDAVQGIIAAFQKHPVVVIGEWQHGIRQMGDFYIELVNDPRLQGTIQDIVIEFASRNNQSLLDRYVNGDNVPMEQARHIWRDTTKVASWESPIYAKWLAAIREVNRKLPAGRRLRVLAGDTAIDWPHINSHADWERLGDNNASFADVIMNEVLAKHRRALVVLGSNHVAKLGHNGAPNTSTMVESRYPGALYVVIHHLIPNDPDERLLKLTDNPDAASVYDLRGTRLGSRPDHNGIAPEKYVDAWLYVGPADTMIPEAPAAGSLEASYWKELDRRSMIEWGDLRTRRFLAAAAAK